MLKLFKYHFSLWGSTTSRRGDNNARRGQVGTAGGWLLAATPPAPLAARRARARRRAVV
eukprot:SAG25_NODE_305_length_10124_cov_16.774464_13_plen_59_part_00